MQANPSVTITTVHASLVDRLISSSILSFSAFGGYYDETDDTHHLDRTRVYIFTRQREGYPFSIFTYNSENAAFESAGGSIHEYYLRYIDPGTCETLGIPSHFGEVLKVLQSAIRPDTDGGFGILDDVDLEKTGAEFSVDCAVVFTYLFHSWQMNDPSICVGLGDVFGKGCARILLRAYYSEILYQCD